jgi:phosphopantothenoylcysteine decarboxylase/phosphopantothenate--cysteine ligase
LLEAVRDAHPDLAVVGFKLETAPGDVLIERAKAAMNRYGLFMVVANTVASMGGDAGEVWIITEGGRNVIHAGGTKDAVAVAVFDSVERTMNVMSVPSKIHYPASENPT